MDRLTEAQEQYRRALRMGQKHYKDCVRRGVYPYPVVLDEILDESLVAGHVDIGVIDVPADQIVGTVTSGRTSAFAANFMPLLDSDTEFAHKWVRLCQAHLGDEGIRDPIRCYEYMGRFYVQEGNKRVSVLKSYGAHAVPGHVIRVVPAVSEESRIYYEFLQFYPLIGIYQLQFTRPGSFVRLQAAMGCDTDHKWTQDERRRFLSGFTYFRDAFRKRGGDTLPITAADALLVWLEFYPFEDLKRTTAAELLKSLNSVWPDVKLLARSEPISVDTDAGDEEKEKGVFGRILSSVLPSHLDVAFVNEKNADTSHWVRTHERGIRRLEEAMGSRVTVRVYNDAGDGEAAERVMEQAVADGAQVIFTTTAPLINECRKIAARYPEVKFLNCSISQPYAGVRTYYSRIYEGKFISGAIAGAMCREDRIGYIASYPIFGIPAGINAFALGAQLTNPRARVKLRWSCLPGDPMEELLRSGVKFISTLDITDPDQPQERRGACMVQPDGTLQMVVSPFWDWGEFYVKIVRSILDGSYDELGSKDGGNAINYWWGLGSGVIGLKFSHELPDGVRSLAKILRRGIADGSVSPFHREIRDQEGRLRNDGSRWFTPDEILGMDWLCDRVEGSIPAFDRLNAVAQPVVRSMGVYRDLIPPEKEE